MAKLHREYQKCLDKKRTGDKQVEMRGKFRTWLAMRMPPIPSRLPFPLAIAENGQNSGEG